MSGFKGIMNNGWHPKGRDGKKESWRNDFKGVSQVAGWMGKGKDKDEEAENHVSRPLTSLKDPASFGPPPKHIKYHGAAALPNEATPDRSGWGAPLSQAQLNQQEAQRRREQEAEEEEKRAAEEAAKRPPVPYRANRTGIDTSTLPPPPLRRIGTAVESAPTSESPKTRPSVPPRVPSRTNTSTPASHSPSPPAYSPSPPATEKSQAANGYINQAATSRLSQAGVSVPELGIVANSPNPTSPSTGYVQQAPVSELQSRFSQLRTNSASTPSPISSPPVRQTQTPPTPASNIGSARSAFKDFRTKHNDQIEAGKQKLSGFNQKYRISDRINNALDSKSASAEQAPPIPPHPTLNRSTTSSSTDTESLARRKAPPPPPPQKKAELRSAPVNTGSPAPPPLPLGTKPR
ncbi:hypothetical protein BDV12DRAFT_159621 [Aspergillus spectabilis]